MAEFHISTYLYTNYKYVISSVHWRLANLIEIYKKYKNHIEIIRL